MSALHTIREPRTYRHLAYLLSAFPLGQVWFVALTTVWGLCLGFLVTPLILPLLIGLSLLIRGCAAVEAAVAEALLGVPASAPPAPPEGMRFWARFRSRFDQGFWKAQAYLLIRWLAGITIAVLVFGLLAAALGMIFGPFWIPFVHGGADLGVWHPHTLVQTLLLVPVGLLLLVLTLLIVNPIATVFRPIAGTLLPASQHAPGARGGPLMPTRRSLDAHGAVVGVVLFVLVLIWALTSRGYFWPVWVALPLALALGIHAWWVVTAEQPELLRHFRGSLALARSCGTAVALAVFFVAIWAITGAGYFWPIWPMLGLGLLVGIHAAAVVLASPTPEALTERIETLETTRAGAVDLQDSELRRIERDLHDGAQARLVALGMSLGMAEQKLAEDPERAGELLAEARAGAEEALRELRDLARGIHPPVLADRGLAAAIQALAAATPLEVNVDAELSERPPATVETAAYFVAAEALANAAKHAEATRVDVRLVRIGADLVVTVTDNGHGGADPSGSGLRGLARRVEAIDGTLTVTSPGGGPTSVRAELPCA